MRGHCVILMFFMIFIPILVPAQEHHIIDKNEYLDMPSYVPQDPKLQKKWKLSIGRSHDFGRTTKTHGTIKMIVILIEFQDVKHDEKNTPNKINQTYFNESSKSLYSYYFEVSYEKLMIKGMVSKWYLSDYTMKEYGEDSSEGIDTANGPIYRLVTESVLKSDDDIDFSEFDDDGDGYVDNLCVVHAGEGQESSLNPDNIWSHRWYDYDEPVVDGVIVGPYLMVSEFSPVGTLAHELAHNLGLPDLYDTDYDSQGTGAWCLMSKGSWNDGGKTPSHLSAWCKLKVGWVNVVDITSSVNLSIPMVEYNPTIYRLWIDRPGGKEYFLIENRQRVGFDKHLPGDGILIWHVDENMKNNRNEMHRLVDLEEADEAYNGDSPDEPTDPWSSSSDGFSPYSTPNSSSYSGKTTGWWVKDIGPSGQIMTLKITKMEINIAITYIDVKKISLKGEEINFSVYVSNMGMKTAKDIKVEVYLYMWNKEILVHERNINTLEVFRTEILTFSYHPTKKGTYIILAKCICSQDEYDDDNYMMRVTRLVEPIFKDDVESGDDYWNAHTNIPFISSIWHIVDKNERYGDAKSGTHSWWCGFDTTGMYTRGTRAVRHILESRDIDLKYRENVAFVFLTKYDISEGIGPIGKDEGYVEISDNRGLTWRRLDTISGKSNDWEFKFYNISSYSDKKIRLRFVLETNFLMLGQGWYLDDIMILDVGEERGAAAALTEYTSFAYPNDTTCTTLIVTNTGSAVDVFEFEAKSDINWNYSFTFRTLRINIFESKEVKLFIKVGDDVIAGNTYTFYIKIKSLSNGRVLAILEYNITGLQTYGFVVNITKKYYSLPLNNFSLPFTVKNEGNGRDEISITYDSDILGMNNTSLHLEPFSSNSSYFVIKIPLLEAGSVITINLHFTSLKNGLQKNCTISIEIIEMRSFSLIPPKEFSSGAPGNNTTISFTVLNTGNVNLTITGDLYLPPNWKFEWDRFIYVGVSEKTVVAIKIIIPKSAFHGVYSVKVILEDKYILTNIIVKKRNASIDVYCERRIILFGESVEIKATVRNLGELPIRNIDIVLYDCDKEVKIWHVENLNVNESLTLSASLRPSDGLHVYNIYMKSTDSEEIYTDNIDTTHLIVEKRYTSSHAFILLLIAMISLILRQKL